MEVAQKIELLSQAGAAIAPRADLVGITTRDAVARRAA
jgi:hypothetical protein